MFSEINKKVKVEKQSSKFFMMRKSWITGMCARMHGSECPRGVVRWFFSHTFCTDEDLAFGDPSLVRQYFGLSDS